MRLMTVVSLLLVGSQALAQGSARLGDRVRIEAPKAGYKVLVGEVSATTPDVISVKAAGYADEVAVRRADITGIHRSVESRQNKTRGAAIGGTLGLFGALSFAKAPLQPGTGTDAQKSFSARNTAIGGVVGAGLGAFIGSFIRTDDWTPIAAAANAGGVTPALGVSVRF